MRLPNISAFECADVENTSAQNLDVGGFRGLNGTVNNRTASDIDCFAALEFDFTGMMYTRPKVQDIRIIRVRNIIFQ